MSLQHQLVVTGNSRTGCDCVGIITLALPRITFGAYALIDGSFNIVGPWSAPELMGAGGVSTAGGVLQNSSLKQ
jgi:hypothetical protein